MRIRTGLAPLAALLAGLVLAAYCFVSAQLAQRSLAATLHRRALFAVSIDQARDRALARERENASSPAASAAAAGDALPVAAPRPPTVAALLAADPKLMDLYLRSLRANLALRYGVYYERYHLTPVQISKFEELITGQAADDMDLRAAAEAQGLNLSDPGIADMRRQSQQQFGVTLGEMALSAGISPLQLKQESAAKPSPQTQALVTSVANLAAAGPAPMTYAQAAQLASIMEAGSNRTPAATGQPPGEDWNKVSAAAAGILPGAQVQAVQIEASFVQLNGMIKEFYAQGNATPSP
jgi:hypothetical protein